MQQHRERVPQADVEMHAELERVQAELATAQQKVTRLKKQLADRVHATDKWKDRAFKGRAPSPLLLAVALLVGWLVGASVIALIVALAGGSLPPLP